MCVLLLLLLFFFGGGGGGALFLLNKIEKIFIYFTDLLTHFLFSFQQNLENLKAKSAAGKVEKKEVECGHGNLE